MEIRNAHAGSTGRSLHKIRPAESARNLSSKNRLSSLVKTGLATFSSFVHIFYNLQIATHKTATQRAD